MYFSQAYEYENLNNPDFCYIAAILVDPTYMDKCLKISQNIKKTPLFFYEKYIQYLEKHSEVKKILY